MVVGHLDEVASWHFFRWVSLPAAVPSRAERCRTVERIFLARTWAGGRWEWQTTEPYTCGAIPTNPEDITGSSAVGGVGAACRRFCRDEREVIIRNFRSFDASLTIDGSSDGEISTKGLPNPHLIPALKDWKTRGPPTAGEGTMSSSGDTLGVSSSPDDELDDQGLPSASDATRGKPRIRDVSGHSRAGCASWGRGHGLEPPTTGAHR